MRTRDVVDKIDAGYLFELFAQMIRADARCFCNLTQRKLFIRMLMDKFSCVPNIHRLSALSVLERPLHYLRCRRRNHPHATTDRD